jgi:hypothetical protein
MEDKKYLFSFVASIFLLISACSEARQMTDSERAFFGRAQISAAQIRDLGREEFLVINPTRPADWEESKGWKKISGIFNQIPSDFFWAYSTPAIEHCSARGQYPTHRGELYGPNARKFRCLSYESWTIEYAQKELLDGLCALRKDSGPELRAEHPCKVLVNSRWNLAEKQCEVYSRLLQTTTFESIPCSDLSSRVAQATSQLRSIPKKGGQTDLDAARRTCLELGFIANSEKFGECVLRLTK